MDSLTLAGIITAAVSMIALLLAETTLVWLACSRLLSMEAGFGEPSIVELQHPVVEVLICSGSDFHLQDDWLGSE